MIQDLPYSGFKWLSNKEINDFDLNSVSENSPIGYILEIDLEYCKELHDSHNDYPLCPEKIELVLICCQNIVKILLCGIKVGGVKKLIPSLSDKVKYVVHYKNLQYYLSLGMKVVKVQRILSFKQSDWLKKYVDFNTKKNKKVVMNLTKTCISC